MENFQELMTAARTEMDSARFVWAEAEQEFRWHHDCDNHKNKINLPCPLVADTLGYKRDVARAELERLQNNMLFLQRMESLGNEPLLLLDDPDHEVVATAFAFGPLPSKQHPKELPVSVINVGYLDLDVLEESGDTLDLNFDNE